MHVYSENSDVIFCLSRYEKTTNDAHIIEKCQSMKLKLKLRRPADQLLINIFSLWEICLEIMVHDWS